MRHQITTIFGKGIKKAAEMRGGGSAFPGLFVEKIDADFTRRTLAQLPLGVVLVSGTNGKTTTTKMVVELLESQGLTVFTNRTGSNFTRGVAAALLGDVDIRGNLAADIAVLELDEAYAVRFVRTVSPSYCLLLNVMRDQLDRFGEIDKTAELLRTIAFNTTKGVVINRDDPRLAEKSFVSSLNVPVASYGVSTDLINLMPSDDNIRNTPESPKQALDYRSDDTQLDDIQANKIIVSFDKHIYTSSLKLKGIYNMQNAVAAIAAVRMIMAESLNIKAMLTALENIEPAFGRGESLEINGKTIEIVLVKNPAGFRLSLASFPSKNADTMIAINDDYADGRDMSWLWDVELDSLKNDNILITSGRRAYDMALRLQYDEINFTDVEPSIPKALTTLLETGHQPTKRIFCTYTAMLSVRRELAKQTKMKVVR